MFKNYFKITFRYLMKNRGFSITNILGLTIGITCTLLILLWVRDELRYNKFHQNYSNIYQVMAHRDFNNQVFTDENMVFPLADALRQNIPEIRNAVVTSHRNQAILRYGEEKFKKEGYMVSKQFFDMFSWKFVKGSPVNAIHDAYSLILTQSTATALFGHADPIGKTVMVDNEYQAVVTAVVEDPPGNSTFRFDYINTFNYDNPYFKQVQNEWVNSSWTVFLQLAPGANLRQIDKKINEIKQSHDPSDKKISTYFSFPMSKWRLYSDFKNGVNTGGMIRYVQLFSIIAFIILLIACVNFMNLSTARSEKRAREVGVRKTLGSEKGQLILQFLIESTVLALIAFVLSLLAVLLLLPAFNRLVDKQLSLPTGETWFWMGSLVIVALTGIVSGSYPALYLSSFKPVRVLKGTFLPGKAALLPRQVLVVVQFVISILLISATLIVYQQLQHIKNRDMGYNPNNLVMTPVTPDVRKNYTVIKQELLNSGLIASVTRTMSPITDIWWRSPGPDYEGKPADANLIFAGQNVDVDYTRTMGIKMIAGHDFTGTPSDTGAMILNRAAVEAMNLSNPLGMTMRYGRSYNVIGVTENVIMGSPFEPVEPMMFYFNPNGSNFVSIRISHPEQLRKAISTIENIFKKYNPSVPFDYQFVDKEFAKKFLTEDLISRLTDIFATLAIFICCIGLAGLASYTIEKRIKEIGIRKVLGASVQQVLMLISKEFLKLVLIAFVIAVPVTWWLMHNWLSKYTFHINLNIWMFLVVGLLVLLLTLVVVSLNITRAAVRNPVKSLRTE